MGFYATLILTLNFPSGSAVKNLPAGDLVQSLAWEDRLGEGMATHFSVRVWTIPWAEESDGLQSKWSQRGGHG